MKIWEKIYVVVIALFLVVLNVCNVIIFQSVYRQSVDTVEGTAITEWKNIAVPLSEDLGELGGPEGEEWQLFQTYVSGYSTEELAFELWRDGELRCKSKIGSQMTYSALEEEIHSDFLVEPEGQKEILKTGEQTGKVTILERGEDKFTCAVGYLAGTSYQLVIYERVSEILQVWKKEISLFLVMEIVASVLMAILLYFVMRKFLQPVSRLSEAAARVADGDYGCQVEVSGRDEISALAADMNWMIGQVRENVENKEQEAERKQEFIDALSHEMRTPLTSICGYAQLVENTRLEEEKKLEYMNYIVRESGRMMEIMETLREITLMNQERLDRQDIPLDKLAEELRRTVQFQMSDKQITFHFRVNGDVIYGNRTLVEMLLLNILRNSYHACGQGGTVNIDMSDERIVTSDDGVGMSEECVKHVFEPFYREDKSRSRKLGGSGLGMYLCRRIVDLHGWQIEIESEKGKGTKITTSLHIDEHLLKTDS